MLLKKGFTLSEILVALAIVGVISAIVLPQVVTNIESSKVGPILGRSIEQIEVGARNMIELANSNQENGSVGTNLGDFMLSDLTGQEEANDALLPLADFRTRCMPFMGLQMVDDEDEAGRLGQIRDNDGNAIDDNNISDAWIMKFAKFPAHVYMYESGNPESDYDETPDQDPRSVVVAGVYIDINGLNSPNMLGRDIFRFNLQNNCKLAPADDTTREIINNSFKLD